MIGGAALALRYYPDGVARSMTDDIDSLFFPKEEMRAEARAVAPSEDLDRGA